MPRDASDLLHGTLDVLVLKALSLGPLHGYSVSEWIERYGDGDLVIVDAALYKALHRLEDGGAIEAEWGRLGKQPKSEVLHADAARTRATPRRDRDVAAIRERGRQDSRGELTCGPSPRAAFGASFGFRPRRTDSREISTRRSRFTSSGVSRGSSPTACRTTKRAPRRCGDSETSTICEPTVTTWRGRICSGCTRPNEWRA